MWCPNPDISYIGRTTFRREFKPFGIRQADRLSHIYIIGKTGVGKSTLIGNLARQDLAAGRGFALLDPHGDLVDELWEGMPEGLRDRVVYLNAPDPTQPYGYNPLRRVRADKIPLAASGLLESLKKQWPDAWGVRMEHVLRNCLYALLEREGATLPDILRLFDDEDFRAGVVRRVKNPVVRHFWELEFENYPPRLRADAIAPIQNKLGALLSDPTLYRILVTPQVDLRLRAIMDEGVVLLVNLAKGRLGEESSALLGGLLVSTLGLAGLSRAELPAPERRPFYVYVDEFQTFTTLAFVSMMAELRKYGVGLTLAHQHLAQIDPEIGAAVRGNAGTVTSFRLGADDARRLVAEFVPRLGVDDLVRLPNRHFYLKVMINGMPSSPFSAALEDLQVGCARRRR